MVGLQEATKGATLVTNKSVFCKLEMKSFSTTTLHTEFKVRVSSTKFHFKNKQHERVSLIFRVYINIYSKLTYL